MTDSLTLTHLSTDELMSLVLEFEPIGNLADRPTVACWGNWWAWRVASELADRIDVPREPQPVMGGLSDLSTAELTALSTYFGAELPILAETLGSRHLAEWCSNLADLMQKELARQDREAAESRARIKAYIDAQRRERPIGTPGDTSGLPPWSEWP